MTPWGEQRHRVSKGALEIGQINKLKTFFPQANPLDAFSRALLQRLKARGVAVTD